MNQQAKKKTVLFLCTGNSCRSQMAEGWLRHLSGGRVEALSAGTKPISVHPLAIRAMAEAGVDISGQRSKSADEYMDREIDLLVTVCDSARESCPIFTGKVGERRHMPFEDPASAVGSYEEVMEVFRRVRDEIRDGVEELLKDMVY
ncbi:arsenate reductase ArsC [bacterium]|nr:MAG: arsenate reductase ArsC [bacterium]